MNEFSHKPIKPINTFKKRVDAQGKKKNLSRFIFIIILAIIAWILFNYVLPTVKVIVVPDTVDYTKDFAIQLSTDASTIEDVFLAKKVEVSQLVKNKFTATGEKDVGDKATGKIVFYNSTGRSQPLTTNIELINDSGIIFVLTQDTTIPGAHVDDQGNVVAGEIEVDIQAKEAGEDGNIGPGRINISALDLDRQSKVYGEVKSALTGGNSKVVTVISQEDIDSAKEELKREIENDIRKKIIKEAGENYYASDSLIVYDDSEISKEFEVDDEVKEFELSLNLKAQALAYDNKKLRIYLRDKILAELPSQQTIAETEFGDLTIQVENFDINLGLADLKINAIFPVAENIDLEKVKQEILGKKLQDARRYVLSLENVKNVQFDFSLSLNTKIPSNPNRVKVVLGEIK